MGVPMKKLAIADEPIELYKVLKLHGMVTSGGEAKTEIAEGKVELNGEVETQKRKKIRAGDIIRYDDEEVMILLEG